MKDNAECWEIEQNECTKKAFIVTQVPVQFKNHRLWQNILLEDVMLDNNKPIPKKQKQNQ
jgi:hypothetical protein